MVIKNCKICNKEFKSKVHNHMFCSPRCREIYQGRKFLNEKIKICIECKKEFSPNKTSPNQKFCSSKCRNKSYGSKFIKDKKRICVKCNKEFIPKQHNQKFCSLVCGKRILKNMIFKCKTCKKEFKPTNTNQLCCSKKCGHINKNKNWKLFYRKQKGYEPCKEINCIICNKRFKRIKITNKWCCKKCKQISMSINANKKYHKNKKEILDKRKKDINYCIKNKLRMRIRCAVKSQGTYKAEKTMNLIGCSVEKLKKYLENKFRDGMTWNNHGFYGWHIDHIKPCCSFNLKNKEEQKKCFNYKNL